MQLYGFLCEFSFFALFCSNVLYLVFEMIDFKKGGEEGRDRMANRGYNEALIRSASFFASSSQRSFSGCPLCPRTQVPCTLCGAAASR